MQSSPHLVALMGLLLFHSVAAATEAPQAQPVRVDVVVLEHADLPALDEKEIESTLDLSAAMMRKALGREVVYQIVARKGYDAFVKDERQRISSHRQRTFNIFTESVASHRDAVIKACRTYAIEALNVHPSWVKYSTDTYSKARWN